MRQMRYWLLIGWFFAGAEIVANTPAVLADEPADQAARQVELQRKYPFESLHKRLAYEQLAPKRLKSAPASREPKNDDGITVFVPRIYALRMLHHAKAEEFFRVPDANGLGRMPRMSAAAIIERTDRPPAELIKFETRPIKSAASGAEQPLQLPKNEGQGMNPGRAPSLRILGHYQYDSEFCSLNSLGYVESIDRVAGFIPHKMNCLPQLSDHPRQDRERRAKQDTSKFDVWRTTQLQLVSLLKNPEPRVYVSEHLPNMNELVNAESRDLDIFERPALGQLQEGEDMVTDATTNMIRMLGALRARNECLACHSVEYGTLLGAFSYILERDPPISAKQLGVLNQQTAASSSARPTGAKRTTTTRAALPLAPRAARR